jgi:subtilase family serine protease
MRRFTILSSAVGVIALTAGAFAAPSGAATTTSAFAAVPGSVVATTDASIGSYSSGAMSIEVALAPSHAAQLQTMLSSVYNSKSASYGKWLQTGQFDSMFAPSAAVTSAVQKYLTSKGLKLQPSSSPFLVRATGSSAKITAAFKTGLRVYRDKHGATYFSNDSAVQLPRTIVGSVLGVVGLANTARAQSSARRAPASKAATSSAATTSCETPYPTEDQLANAALGISGFPFGYGGGPGCNGLTPAQDNSIYSAPNVGARGKGSGVNIAVFELSAYQQSDIQTWAKTFYGPSYNAPLADVNVDGGPLNPICPVGDQCPPDFNGYAGDIEVDADIEMQLAIAPDVKKLTVYNAPNDFSGQTELDEYTQIAKDNTASSISSSWAVCENDVPSAGYVQAENVIFEKMALQGQSMFGAEGDTGAFSCIRSDGTTIANLLDPPAQPWVTSVGGTSLETYNPGTKTNPAYPTGTETVWNVLNLCNSGAGSDGLTGFDWCAAGGAGGGGNSEWWGRPIYQVGPGVNNPNTAHADSTTNCRLAKAGTPCREAPDISVNADEYTPYAEYCTGNANTPQSVCGTFSGGQTPPGWFGIGGTSLSSPFWSAIIADRNSYQGRRSGNVNPLLYLLYNLAPGFYFHDINGSSKHVTNNNGLFPTVSGYDLATGIGTPIMSALITKTL